MTVKTNSVIGNEVRNLLLDEVIMEHSVGKEEIPPDGRNDGLLCLDERFLPAVGMTVRWVLIGWGQAAAPPVPNPSLKKRMAVISRPYLIF